MRRATALNLLSVDSQHGHRPEVRTVPSPSQIAHSPSPVPPRNVSKTYKASSRSSSLCPSSTNLKPPTTTTTRTGRLAVSGGLDRAIQRQRRAQSGTRAAEGLWVLGWRGSTRANMGAARSARGYAPFARFSRGGAVYAGTVLSGLVGRAGPGSTQSGARRSPARTPHAPTTARFPTPSPPSPAPRRTRAGSCSPVSTLSLNSRFMTWGRIG